jgi:hypothetical protein
MYIFVISVCFIDIIYRLLFAFFVRELFFFKSKLKGFISDFVFLKIPGVGKAIDFGVGPTNLL